jgi:hypothetical protein
MAEDADQPQNEVEFISAQEDANVRLNCFVAATPNAHDFAENLAHAKTLYNWVMDWESIEDAIEAPLASEAECTRKH